MKEKQQKVLKKYMNRVKRGEATKKGNFKQLVKLPKDFNDKVEIEIDEELYTRTNNETMRHSNGT